ncbi:hypothetical protein [Couchioplanes caeruleus]|uniref:Uncharacterized protein n=2 Tax=Couchioplanes caeruleus TaxID=56438 RepID=A0A1K0FRS8_9ACTN|nr:hypothetical protein [Couchioplanes caeruleus]OJF15400.1 hypothetical protein BG844_04680 [Couchioplanes caeruleus subsp. caeruleus]ROP33441.1 hypothetical protein EDD30_6423 [Couchioplanes caeruleus]
MIPQNPTAVGVVVSTTIKAVLVAIAALNILPLDDDQIAAVTLALAAVADLAVYFGWVKPRVDGQVATALATPPPAIPPRPGRSRNDI